VRLQAGFSQPRPQQDATLRTMALGTLILNAFSVRAAPGRFIRCRRSAIQNNVQTNTFDPPTGRSDIVAFILPSKPANQPRIFCRVRYRRSFLSLLKSILPFAVTFLCESFV
jgi:hypothetical protein